MALGSDRGRGREVRRLGGREEGKGGEEARGEGGAQGRGREILFCQLLAWEYYV